ncbi:MAG: translocation/assembly module TamB domain-containing protein [Steroidobacteraceae bacterium]
MRKALKFSAWALGGLALLTLLLSGAVFIAGNTSSGRAAIERLTLHLTAGHVSLSGLNGSFPHRLTLERLQLSDYRGVWLSADGVSVDWSPLALLARRFQINSVHAAGVDLQRLPESPPNAPVSGPVSIPRIDVAALSVDVVALGAQLAGVPAKLALRGNVHLRSVQDMVIDAAAHRLDGDGDYDLRLRFDRKRMDAALNLHEPAGGPLENILQLPGLGALQATVNLNGPRSAERLELSVAAGALRGQAQGGIDFDDLSADLEFALDSPALAPRADLAWDRASVRGRWQGSIKAPHADGHVEINGLRLPGAVALAAFKGDLKADSGKAALHAVIEGLRIPGPRPQLLQSSPVTLDASMRLDAAARPLELTASHSLFSLQASAPTAAAAGKRSAAVELRLPNVSELAALAGQDVRGSAVVKVRLQEQGVATRMNLDANAALSAGPEIWSGVVGDKASLQLSGVLTDRVVTLESMKFAGRAASLSASGELARVPPGKPGAPSLRGRWDLNVSDLKAVSPLLAGNFKASGTLAGPMTALAGDAQLTSSVSVRNSPSGTVSASMKVHGLPFAPSGTFSAQGLLDEAPVHVDVAMERNPAGAVRVLIRRADWKSAHAEGDATIAIANGTAGAAAAAQTHGQLQLRVGDLADLKDLLGTDLGGSLAGTVLLHPDRGTTHAQLHFDARDLAVDQFKGSAQLSAEGVIDALGFKLELQLPDLRGSKASLSASGSLNLGERKLALAAANLNYRGQDVRLLSAAQIAFADGFSVDVLRLGVQSAVLQLRGEISPALDLRASLRQVQPALVNAFVPGLLTSGTIEARARLQGTVASPTGQVRLTATDMRMADDAAFGLPAVDLQASADLTGDTANLDVRLSAGTASRLNVTGQAPLAASGTLNLKISGGVDVGMINPLLEARGQHATGELSVDATVGGSVAEPKIEGTVNLTKGSVRDYARGLGLTDITAAVVGSQGTLQIKSLTGTAAPGTVSMTGSIGVLQAGIPVDLHIKAENAQPLVSKLVTANLNADLRVSGTARERLDIAGSVNLNRTLIGIPNSLPPNVAVLDLRRRGTKAPAPVDKPLVIGLDVAVKAPQEILVQGRGLDAEMGGDLHLSGTTDAPAASGRFGLLRGNFSLSGNKLNFTPDSNITFNGAGLKNSIDPTLDFTAQTTVGVTTVTLKITGQADAPQFELTSSPPLGQDEIMAQLLFGTSVQQLSGLQLAQIGATLATLSGVGGDSGLNPLAKLQKSLGLDRLDVGSGTTYTSTGAQSSGASIAAGRYITKRIYVQAKQTSQGSSQLETDVDLTRHLKLQTRLGNGTASVQGVTPDNDPGSSVGLQYLFEY